jgi:alanyl-tRNA synthetase
LLPERISTLVAELKAAEKKIAAFEASRLSGRVPALVEQQRRVGAYLTVVEDLGELSTSDDLRTLVTTVRERLGSEPVVVALAARIGGKPAVIVGTNQAARDAGAKAGALAKGAAGVLGGGGGGKDDLAQGGGSDVEAIAAALDGIVAALG